MERVILVNGQDEAIGVMEKMEAHRKGELHRAFSIIVVNPAGEWLLQKRALTKYHSGGLWTNTCCSHQQPHRPDDVSVRERLQEEMGFVTDLHFAYKFQYRAELGDHMIEHEYDHVFVGRFDGVPLPNPAEADGWRFLAHDLLLQEMAQQPAQFTCWFRLMAHHPAARQWTRDVRG